MVSCEIFVVVDEEGAYIASHELGNLDYGEMTGAIATYRILVDLPTPPFDVTMPAPIVVQEVKAKIEAKEVSP